MINLFNSFSFLMTRSERKTFKQCNYLKNLFKYNCMNFHSVPLFQELDETEKSFQELEDKENDEDGLYSVLYILFYSRDFFRTFYLKLVFVYLTYLLLFIFFCGGQKKEKNYVHSLYC